MISETSIITAFLAGFISFLASCTLPLIPPYIAWLSGVSLKDDLNKKEARIKIFLNSVFLILGFSIIFIILGASASFIGKILSPHRLLVQRIGGSIIILFGLDFIGFLKIFKNYRINLIKGLFSKIGEKTSSFLIGLTFAFAWVACFSPILGSILVLSSFQGTLSQGVILLSFYSLGLAIPFLLTSLFLGLAIEKIKKFTKIIKWINLLSGIILIVLGLLLITDKFYKIVMLISKLY
ncbi:cytochrome c biogenesis protein CcdA [Patescibacteria group bacterium]|nr:cytochrome c biogenesis protein CcdA [Patescibacteria group bacterium]